MSNLSLTAKLSALFWEGTEDESLRVELCNRIIQDFLLHHEEQVEKWVKNNGNYIYSTKGNEIIDEINEMLIYREEEAEIDINNSSILGDLRESLNIIDRLQSLFSELDSYINFSKELIAGYNVKLDTVNAANINDVDSLNKKVVDRINELLKENFSQEVIDFLRKSKIDTDKLDINEKINLYKNTLCNMNISNKLELITARNVNCDSVNKTALITNLYEDNLFDFLGNEIVMIDILNKNNFSKFHGRFEIKENIKENISNIFNIPKNSKYLITAEAYLEVMNNLQIRRAKSKECYICGEKLGVFSKYLTCKRHRQYEIE